MLTVRFWLTFVLALLLASPSMAAIETRNYELHHSPAEDVALQLRTLYPGDQAAITAHGQRMVIRADTVILDEIGQLIDTMDVAPVQLRITVRSGGTDNGVHRGGSVSVQDGRVTVSAESRTTTTRRQREQTLVILDGQSAHIHSGQVRVLPLALQGGFNPAVLYQQVPIRSGFVVSPRVISGQQVELSVMAFDNMPVSEQPGYQTEAVMTSRRVAPGTWVDLGSSSQSSVRSERGIVYQVGNDGQGGQRFQVRIDLL
ncbi:secretin [Marinobacter sp. SS21]|uniref:secretin n=1 Tax=Marinobacter sp. SS21 TaxID=2979460 RepID=UPI00232C09CA|nr:secretin [Marinobacter sp. SS21]MDC0662339.1 secretin [Marinobacter sp. SS21]